MIRGLLILLMSLGGCYCIAQEPGISTDSTVDNPDSAYIIKDLVHIIRENSKVLLNWRIVDSSLTDFVSIERSSNSREFEVVAVLKLEQFSKWFEWIDESPAKGKNIYRIKCSLKDNRQVFSKTIHAQVAGDLSFKFYPNPVDNILIIRSENQMDVQIVDGAGKIRMAQANVQGLQTINVSSLEKGIYVLRLHNKTANTIVQDRLLKN